eukprot:3223176-Pleurochrysis_carterae.AAC.2
MAYWITNPHSYGGTTSAVLLTYSHMSPTRPNMSVVKLVTKLWRDHILGQLWTDCRPVSLRGKLIVTSHLVTSAYLELVMHVCRFLACLDYLICVSVAVAVPGREIRLCRAVHEYCSHDGRHLSRVGVRGRALLRQVIHCVTRPPSMCKQGFKLRLHSTNEQLALLVYEE